LGSSVFAGKSKHIQNIDASAMTSSAGTVHQGNCQTNWRGRLSAGKPSIGDSALTFVADAALTALSKAEISSACRFKLRPSSSPKKLWPSIMTGLRDDHPEVVPYPGCTCVSEYRVSTAGPCRIAEPKAPPEMVHLALVQCILRTQSYTATS